MCLHCLLFPYLTVASHGTGDTLTSTAPRPHTPETSTVPNWVSAHQPPFRQKHGSCGHCGLHVDSLNLLYFTRSGSGSSNSGSDPIFVPDRHSSIITFTWAEVYRSQASFPIGVSLLPGSFRLSTIIRGFFYFEFTVIPLGLPFLRWLWVLHSRMTRSSSLPC